MNEAQQLAAEQLGRMRGMTVEYHRQFFRDVRLVLAAVLALFVLGFWLNPAPFLLIPFVALFGAVQTAFSASYLIFARHYAVRLEHYLNEAVGESILLGGAMEEHYLFPLDRRKVVTLAVGKGFSWFGYMTFFFTALGIAAYGFGLALGWNGVLSFQSAGWRVSYLTTLFVITLSALVAGIWWFVGGTGETRLNNALEPFPSKGQSA